MRKTYHVIVLFAVFLMMGTNAAQAQQVDYKFHTVFIYNFTKYIKWPDTSVGNEFVIAVYGNSEITGHLQKMAATKSVNGKPIVVKVFNSSAEVAECHMLFLPESKSKELSALRTKLATKPTLIISEKDGLGKEGSDINFIVNNGRWNFEINQASADMHQLKISGELTKFAHKIYTEI